MKKVRLGTRGVHPRDTGEGPGQDGKREPQLAIEECGAELGG